MTSVITKYKNVIILTIALLIVIPSTYTRVNVAHSLGNSGDFNTHMLAVTQLVTGTNPYIHTLKTYSDLNNDPGNKGYAYLPGIMYLNTLVLLGKNILQFYFGLNISTHFLFIIPGIVANLFIGLFFYKTLYTKDKISFLFALLIWFYNPLFYQRGSLEGYDAITVALIMWAIYFLEKDDVITGVLYSLSIIFKTFPLIFAVIFLLKSKNKLNFILSGVLIYIVVSLPFMLSLFDFITYFQGSLLVHSNRFIQGRPFLQYVSWYYKIELFRIIPFKVYTYLSVFSGLILSSLNLIIKPLTNKYVASLIPMSLFYLFTPVLNRTYILWGLPIFLVGLYELFESKNLKPLFYVVNGFIWVFLFWYLAQWKDGFHIWHPIY